MNNKKDSRRKLLKSIAASGGAIVAGKSVPESWSKPVVDAVILPAHAKTTKETLPTTTLAPTTTCNPSGAWTAQSSFSDGIVRDLVFYDVDQNHLLDETGSSSVSMDSGYLNGVSGYFGMGYVDSQQNVTPPVSATLTVTTDCSSITVTQNVTETIGGGNGATTAMVRITFPEGLLEEVSFIIPPP